MGAIEQLLHDGLNHAFEVDVDLGDGFVVHHTVRTKRQLLFAPYTPGVTDIVISHLATCACKPLTSPRRTV